MRPVFGFSENGIEVWESHMPDAPKPYAVYIRVGFREWWVPDVKKGLYKVEVEETLDSWENMRGFYKKAGYTGGLKK